MEALRFEWDEAEIRSNQRKHGLSFEKASAVFLDPLYVAVQGRIENGEPRWQTLGVVGDLLLLTVSRTVREESDEGTEVEVIRKSRHASMPMCWIGLSRRAKATNPGLMRSCAAR